MCSDQQSLCLPGVQESAHTKAIINILIYRLFLAIVACPQCPPLQQSWISSAYRDHRENSKQAHLLLSSQSTLRLGTRHIN